jgi:hypothetical protein
MTESTVQRRDRLVAAAIEAAGSDDFGPDSWREGLDLFLESLTESAALNEIGVGVAEDGVVNDLATSCGSRPGGPRIRRSPSRRSVSRSSSWASRAPAPRSCST